MFLAPLLVMGLLWAGCIQSRCVRHSECPAGEVCLTTTGACVVPACTTDGECSDDRVCRDFQCVAGCRFDDDCPDGEKCFDKHCVPAQQDCDCPAAPVFCAPDLNPASATSGQDLCVPKDFEDGVALFFGSVGCSNCRHLFYSLDDLATEIGAGGKPGSLVWIQLKSEVAGPDAVSSNLGDTDRPVLHDTEDRGVWEAYGADWYHLVIVDRNGCLADHFGPLGLNQVEKDLRQEIGNAWAGAMNAPCQQPPLPDTSEHVPDILEPVPDVADDTGHEDITPDLPPEIPAPIDVITADTVDVTEIQDISIPPDDGGQESFIPADVCQVVTGAPITNGDPVPHFLCTDVNPSSSLFGSGISDIFLKEMAWIAYFGSCT